MHGKSALICLFVLIVTVLISSQVMAVDTALDFSDILKLTLESNIELKMAELEMRNAEIEYRKNELNNLATESRMVKLQGEINMMEAEKMFNDIKENTVVSILNKYLNLILVNNEIDTNKKEVNLEQRKVQRVKAQVETGYKGTIDLFTQQNEYRKALNQLTRNEDKKKRLEHIIKFNTGERDEYEIKINPLPEPDIRNIEEENVIDRAVNNSRELEIAQRKIEYAKANYEKAVIKKEPELNLKQIKNSLTIAKMNYRNERQQLIEEILNLYADYIQALRDLELARDGLKQTEKNYKIITEQNSQGLVTDIDVLEAKINMLRVENSYIKAKADYYLSNLKLKQATGEQNEVNMYAK